MIGFGLTLAALVSLSAEPPKGLRPTADAWTFANVGAVRGVTIGPIESIRHPNKGYGSEAYQRALDESVALGATWVSLTPFGRVWDLTPEGIDKSFEAPFVDNRKALILAARQAHERGLRVLLVPHLWVESGEWRALIKPVDEAGWRRWAASYQEFLLAWAQVAHEAEIEMLSVGVELRSWVTTPRADSFVSIVEDVRKQYSGLLTYSANWDDANDTLIWDHVDLIGINAFYPLAQREGADLTELSLGGKQVATQVEDLARGLRKPVLFTEVGYTTRRDPALRPWEWPDGMKDVVVDEQAQADAYRGLLAGFVDADYFAGFFVWRYYADPDDVSQEAAWGFSPRGKQAEVVLRDAFAAHWAADGTWLPGAHAGRHRARTPGFYGWEASPPLFAPDTAKAN